MKLYTKNGDDGGTGLLFGKKVSKADSRTEAYGSLDSAISAMGLARSLVSDLNVKEILLSLQMELFTVGSELATPPADLEKLKTHYSVVTPEMVQTIEDHIDDFSAKVKLPRAFIVPGASPGSGAMDLARSLVRTAERRAVGLKDDEELPNPEVIKYLNRLSDLLFILARYEDRDLPADLTTGERVSLGSISTMYIENLFELYTL